MPYPIDVKEKAITLRKQGYSIKEVAAKLNIAQSTSSVWLSDIILSIAAQKRLEKRKILGQYKSIFIRKKAREKRRVVLEKTASEMLLTIPLSQALAKLCCSLVWWCEGNKNTTSVKFTSSDPTLIGNFLSLLRTGFKVDESKLRALVHIHGYHNNNTQKQFWSKITGIPIDQFHKSYLKPNTGKRLKENYPGCLALVYYDASIAKELKAIYNVFSKFRGVG
ncbi:helix-turn-helix domain containing protein [Patescibacteria group bacterium]|nr:helix-turn-helix domain containing protein [Patescibacteria group bacterium]